MKIKSALIGLGLLLFSQSVFGAASESKKAFDLKTIGNLPVVHQGRHKPLLAFAENMAFIIHGKRSIQTGSGDISPLEWVLNVRAFPKEVDSYPLFQVNNRELRAFLGELDLKKKYFSPADLAPLNAKIMEEAKIVQETPAPQRDAFQRAVMTLASQMELYFKLENSFFPEPIHGASFENEIKLDLSDAFLVFSQLKDSMKGNGTAGMNPEMVSSAKSFLGRARTLHDISLIRPSPPFTEDPSDPGNWDSYGSAMESFLARGSIHSILLNYAVAFDAYRNGTAAPFNKAVADMNDTFNEVAPAVFSKSRFEANFIRIQPFYACMVLYLLVFALCLLDWSRPQLNLTKRVRYLGWFVFVLHSVALLARMYIQGRPPVTNLYSSAVFVGWGAFLFGALIDGKQKNGIGIATGSLASFVSLIVAGQLSTQGDTLEVMRAVLDSNFWLATHVVVITLGYSATFLAGFVGIFMIVKGWFQRKEIDATTSDLFRMMYGAICFGLLFSFVGTVLGGIWADQSWGRFWGWDPKENGALLIVLWNAILLHGLRDGLFSARGIAVGAVFGNVITSLAWFGVNMLGVGLHSYGFMDKAFLGLLAFSLANFALMGLGWALKERSARPSS